MRRGLALLLLGAAEGARELWPNELVMNQAILPGERVLYALQTNVDEKYEVKLSYRATTPSFFELRVLDEHELDSVRSMRRVLNTEKTFVTGKAQKQYVEVTMKVEGISFRLTQQQLAERETKFDILLEKVILGGVPVSAVTLILVILTFLGLMLVFVYPKVNDLLHQPSASKNV